MSKKINFIGAGNLGKTIAKLIVKYEVGVIQGIANRSVASSAEAIKFIGEGAPYTIETLPPADITFITTSDDAIQACCDTYALSQHVKSGSVILHCSGSLSSEILFSAKAKGCLIASVHPMRSFAHPSTSVDHYNGTYCAIEGDKEATLMLHEIFRSLGSITYDVDRNKKGSYHAAGVFASNYLVTLCHEALECLKEADVNDEAAIKVILSLMRGTLNNLETTLSPEKSLTGPIKRGDINTIKKHLQAIADPRILALYKQLGLATLKVAALPKDIENEIGVLFIE